jgi:Tfp pilus assembly protein PilZ
MLSTLHQYIDLNKVIDEPAYRQGAKRYEVIARLYLLLNKLSEEQLVTLLKLLLRNRMVDYLFKLTIDLSDTQRLVLMKQLKQITSKTSHYDRRKFIRKNCLINAKISVANKIFICFILDISPYGAFVDTSEGIMVGQTAKLMFSSPNNCERLILSAEVAWSKDEGSGLKFSRLTPKQLDLIRTFTENGQKVYEINSC